MPTFSRIATALGLTIALTGLAAAGLRPDAPPVVAGPLPCLAIQEIATDSVTAYADALANLNRIVQDKFQLDTYRHVFVGDAAGPESGIAYVVSRGESFAAIDAQEVAFGKEAALTEARLHLGEIRTLKSKVLYKAARYSGTHPRAATLNTKLVTQDEASYVQALDVLQGLCQKNGFQDVHVNCYRAVAGRTEWTHLVALSCPNRERCAQLMDAIHGQEWGQQWLASVAKLRTVVSSGTFRDITPTAGK